MKYSKELVDSFHKAEKRLNATGIEQTYMHLDNNGVVMRPSEWSDEIWEGFCAG
ncbi:MAG: hypothetical protein LBC43_01610 [Bifidobacteriaceae bacterium]|jgi:hypothetical protein|nr:hypothetical protein [Bifidobacteriaceae bacterium]